MSDEQQYWRRLIEELQGVMTIDEIAEAVGVENRQVYHWKAGERRPMGMKAIAVYLLHAKHCPVRHCREGHSQEH